MAHLYVNNTTADTRQFGIHEAITEATKNDGQLPEELPEELADLFTLTRCPEGSAAEWRLDWA